MFFKICIKKFLILFFKKTTKEWWSKEAHVAPYNVVRPITKYFNDKLQKII